jgi:dynein heavy chain, axonemal
LCRVPENVYIDNIDLLGEIFVDTIDTVRCRIFLELANLAGQNVIVFGQPGSGKTKLIQEFTNQLGKFFLLFN